MKLSESTIGELFEHPNLEALVSQDDKIKISEYLVRMKNLPTEPLYIKILIGAGAWFATGFLLIFVVLIIGYSKEVGAIYCGIIFLAAAILIDKFSNKLFLSQVSLVMALAGNVLTVGGTMIRIRHHEVFVAFLVHAFICGIVYPFYKNSLYRFLAPLAFVIFAIGFIVEADLHKFIHILIFAEMILLGLLVTYKKLPTLFIPLTYASALMLPATLLFMNLMQINKWRENFNEPLWPSSLLLSGGLIYLYINLASGMKKIREPWMVLAIFTTILLGVISTPGILVAIALLIIGYAHDDRIFSAMSYLFLICFLGVFYYALNIDLYQKSLVIAGSGGLLLLVRWATCRLKPLEVPA